MSRLTGLLPVDSGLDFKWRIVECRVHRLAADFMSPSRESDTQLQMRTTDIMPSANNWGPFLLPKQTMQPATKHFIETGCSELK